MIFNRVINDIVDWIRRVLYWKNKQIKHKPYAVLEMYTCVHGILKLVERDTPRAVITYVYTPKSVSKTNVVGSMYDYHICLDHLWVIGKEEKQNKKINKTNNTKLKKHIKVGATTHVLTILKSSRTLNPNGDYVTEIIYYKQFDFLGSDISGYRDKFALPIIKDVVNRLKEQDFKTFEWDFEISFSQKRFMGSYYMKNDQNLNV